MADEPEFPAAPSAAAEQLQRALSLVGTVIAPASLVTALLFYFGYVSARAQFDYFGLDADTIGLTTRDYVMRSPQPLLVPILGLVLLAAGAATVHATVQRRLAYAPERVTRLRRALLGAGGALLAGAGALVGLYRLLGGWAAYALVAPVLLATGAALVAYALGLGGIAGDPRRHRAVRLTLVALVVVSAFWATATLAQWSGRGLAKEQARDLRLLPSVVVDRHDRWFLPTGAGVEERALPTDTAPDAYRFRYSNLRLLVQGPERMFLVPSVWTPAATTLAVPLDGTVRVQFQFRNDPP